MRVLVAPGLDPGCSAEVLTLAQVLAGDGEVVPLRTLGLKPIRRVLSGAEVHLVREALLGTDPDRAPAYEERAGTVVGYVCGGRALATQCTQGWVAVADHVDLAWGSPLTGPNDDRLGPRFPRVDQVYAPAVVHQRVATGPRTTMTTAVVAGVRSGDRLSGWQARAMDALGVWVVSPELVPVALVAAHLGLRLAAVVVL